MNQTPEQIARDKIDKQLTSCGWVVQNKKHINLSSNLGVAVTEYNTDAGNRLRTKEVWIYDFRTNIHFTLKKNPLKFEDLA